LKHDFLLDQRILVKSRDRIRESKQKTKARITHPKRPSLEKIQMKFTSAASMMRVAFTRFETLDGQNKSCDQADPDYAQSAIQGGKKYSVTRIVPGYIPWQHAAQTTLKAFT
jgi:hypothetical protein